MTDADLELLVARITAAYDTAHQLTNDLRTDPKRLVLEVQVMEEMRNRLGRELGCARLMLDRRREAL